MKTLYMHIGMPKTGTSTIQEFCYKNKKILLENNIFYPDIYNKFEGYSSSQWKLSQCALLQHGLKNVHLSEARNEFNKILSDEYNFLISSEWFLYDDPSLFNFNDKSTEIILYFRWATSFFESILHYIQVEKHSSLSQNIQSHSNSEYIKRWVSFFNEDKFMFKNYDNIKKEQLVYDFLSSIGISQNKFDNFLVVKNQNTAFMTEYALFLYHLRQLPIPNNQWGTCVDAVQILSATDENAVKALLTPSHIYKNPTADLLETIRLQAQLLHDPSWEDRCLTPPKGLEPYPDFQLPASVQHDIFERLPDNVKNTICEAWPAALRAKRTDDLLPPLSQDPKLTALTDQWRKSFYFYCQDRLVEKSKNKNEEKMKNLEKKYVQLLLCPENEHKLTKVYEISENHGLRAIHHIDSLEYDAGNNSVCIVSNGHDPIVILPKIDVKPCQDTIVQVSAFGPCCEWQLFYCTEEGQTHSGERVINFDPTASDGASFLLPPSTRGDNLRLDTGNSNGAYVIKNLNIYTTSQKSIYDNYKSLSNAGWCKTLCRSVTENTIDGVDFPGFPAEQTQIDMVGSSGEHTLKEMLRFYDELHTVTQKLPWQFSPETKILDFGCGFGRLTRYFLKDTRAENIFGTDTVVDFINICKKIFPANSIPESNFLLNEPFPPSQCRDESFDLITAYSVLTHLSEIAANAWIKEIHRILKPGGLFVFTLRQMSYLQYCSKLSEQENLTGYSLTQVMAFGDISTRLPQYESGEFIYYPSGGGKFLSDSFYGDTVIPPTYIEKYWTKDFSLVEMFDDPQRCSQAFCVLQKKNTI